MKFKLLALLCCFATPLFAQNFTAQQPFHLINIGNGAAALGMGGAYVAVAEDLSALTWNPAGLSNDPGFKLQFDSSYTTGSEEFEVRTSQTGTTQQNYSVHGFQPQSLALTYQWKKNDLTFGPSFGWGRSSLNLTDYELDVPVTGHSIGPFFSDGEFVYQTGRTYSSTGEDTYSFGFSLKFRNHLSIGGAWNILGGEFTEDLFIQNSFNGILNSAEPAPFTSVLNRTLVLTEKISGNYLNLGILYELSPKASLGGTVRFGYSREREVSDTGDLDIVTTIGDNTTEFHSSSTSDPFTIESKLPIELSGGVAIRLTPKIRFALSLTYGDYSSEDVNSYPTKLTIQSSLIQWRNGLEYQINDSALLRAGWILDDQPYTKQYFFGDETDDSPFYGYTFGGGWHTKNVGFDLAFLHESGTALSGLRLGGITDHDFEFSDRQFSHNRFFFTVNFRQ